MSGTRSSASGDGRFSLSAGAVGSLLLHGALLALALVFVHGITPPAPPKPPTVVTLDLTPPPPKPPPPKPQPPKPKPPPPKPQPTPTPMPQPITSQTLSSVPMPSVPPPPAPDQLADAKPLPQPPPQGPQPGVVGYHISDAYKSLLENKIQGNLRYPPMAARRGQQGTVLVKVRMQRDGTVESIKLVKGAGTGSLDDEAQAVFKRIGKLPPLPKDFLPTAAAFEFEIPITFRLVDG